MSRFVRFVLVGLFALGLVVSITNLVHFNASLLDSRLELTGRTDVFRLTSLSGVRVAGDVRPGDLLLDRDNQEALRFAALVYPATVTLFDLRTKHVVEISDVRSADPHRFNARYLIQNAPFLVGILIQICALGLLLTRGRQRGVVPLCIFLFTSQFVYPSLNGFLFGSIGAEVYSFLQIPLTMAWVAALVQFARDVTPENRIKRPITIFALAALACMALVDVADDVRLAVTGAQWIDVYVSLRIEAAVLCLVLVMFVAGFRKTAASERRRIVILGLATLIGSTINILALFGGPTNYNEIETNVALCTTIVMVVGLIYGILVEHLFDIAFVVNRAVVYGATSALVVLSFVAIEWVVGWTASAFGHVDSAALQLVLAIVVALSLRPIHGRVDSFVDNAIFAARHRSANALRRFAEDCGEYRTEAALLAATLDTLHTYARVCACALYLADEDGDLHPRVADEALSQPWSGDDVALVRMRTSRVAIFRSEFPQFVFADVAFPMLRRRALIGAIVCSLPARAEPYSPEECEALATVAREVGASLVALEAAAAQRLATENAELRARFAVEGVR